jgi:hypothetical protein
MAKRGLSSVQRTMRECRNQGRFVEKVEQWISYGGAKTPPKPGMPAGTRRDAFGFIDILAIDPHAIVAIQACTQSSKKHFDKIIQSEYAKAWVEAGGAVELWCWRKVKLVRGGKAVRWSAKITYITLENFEANPLHQPLKEL